ncbi:MAG TPA: MbnH family di-heme enzyme [Vicinamibacterales bacterium]|jgi:cytochrome c peroxidase
MTLRHLAAVVWLGAATATVLAVPPSHESSYTWDLPDKFPTPRVPADNPMSEAKVTLGRHLFYDTRLSGNGTYACATCHEQARAFTDGRAQAIGSTGERHPRGSMSLVNVAYAAALTWGNPTVTRLEDQALVPMYGTHPVELGLPKDDRAVLTRLKSEPRYRRLFVDAFGNGDEQYSIVHVTQAIASFERSIVSARSPYDRYHDNRDDSAISTAARRGETLFFSQPLSCFRCHGGFTLSGAVDFEGHHAQGPVEFHNTGLYNIAGALSYPPPNTGVYEVTHRPEDVGRFKAPTLRNIAVTAPYMHDGSAATLEDVIAHYAAGGRTIASGEYKGVGHDNPNRSPTVRGFTITDDQRSDLIAFLKSLTDDQVLTDPRFSNPWTHETSEHKPVPH